MSHKQLRIYTWGNRFWIDDQCGNGMHAFFNWRHTKVQVVVYILWWYPRCVDRQGTTTNTGATENHHMWPSCTVSGPKGPSTWTGHIGIVVPDAVIPRVKDNMFLCMISQRFRPKKTKKLSPFARMMGYTRFIGGTVIGGFMLPI